MAKTKQIVGICLVRNEERFFNLVLANIKDFCDQILIADHKSTDTTSDIAQHWAQENGTISFRSIGHPAESHAMVMPYVDSNTWVFAVDGDEIYDRQGLVTLRQSILEGNYDAYWRVIGNVLNCTALDLTAKRANGYLSPPSRSITKLYNFSAISNWSGVGGERLHGGEISFKKGFEKAPVLRLHEQVNWDHSIFRCLHLCFLPRSNSDKVSKNGIATRWNLAEQQSKGIWTLLVARILGRLGISRPSIWKQERYGRGELVTKDIAPFLDKGVITC